MEDIKKLRAKTFAGIALCKEALLKSDGNMDKAVEYVNERSDVVSRLYNQTGAKIIHCKIAFEEAEQDFEKALEIIKERGWMGDITADTKKKKEGILGIYAHGEQKKLVAVVEVFCDTDFVARNEEFQKFAQELAMQAAAMGAKYASRDSVPEEVIEAEKKVISESDELKDKPEDVIEKILEGKMLKFYEENCLLEQKYFRDDSKKVEDLFDEALTKLGEKLSIGRIYRIQLGE